MNRRGLLKSLFAIPFVGLFGSKDCKAEANEGAFGPKVRHTTYKGKPVTIWELRYKSSYDHLPQSIGIAIKMEPERDEFDFPIQGGRRVYLAQECEVVQLGEKRESRWFEIGGCSPFKMVKSLSRKNWTGYGVFTWEGNVVVAYDLKHCRI